MKIDYEHSFKLFMKYCFKSIANMATARNFEVISDKFNMESVVK
jgi:hypothetical protein